MTFARHRVMIADDEVAVTLQLKERLTSLGFEVIGTVSSGEKAVAMARRLRPDMVLMDIVMSGEMDGIEACRTIKGELDIPVVLLAAQVDNNLIEKAKKVGPSGYLFKPFREKELKLAIELAIHKKEERRKMQEQLLQIQKLEAIGTLAGGVAHEFNNILTVIQGYTDLAMRQIDEAEPVYGDLKEIATAVSRAANLTWQLLAFSRKQSIRPVLLNFNRVVDDLKQMLSHLIGENIAIVANLEPDLWIVQADKAQMEQIIMDLVLNARDAMPEGGIVTIRTENVHLDEDYCDAHREAHPGRFVCLSVQDTGVGMDKETVGRIFEPFFTTRDVGEGTGLGLSAMYGIVKQHQGWVNVNSRVNQGSVFEVYLPAFSGKVEGETKEVISLENFEGRGEKILLVEDEEEVLTYAARAFSDGGYIVFKARNVKEAWEIFEKENGDFHLIFCDVVLPDGNGLQLVEELLSRQADLAVVLSSGYADHQSRRPLIEKKRFPFLQKPYSLSDLLRVTKEAIKRSHGEDNYRG